MAQMSGAQVLRHKIGDRRVPGGGDASAIKRAFRMACRRSGAEFADLDCLLTGLRDHQSEMEPWLPDVAAAPVRYLLSGQAGQGLALADPQAITAIVDHATTGAVGSDPPEERPPSRTEAVIFGDFLDLLLSALHEEIEEMPNPPRLPRLACDRILPDVKSVETTLEDAAWRRFDLVIEFGGGARQGEVVLFFAIPGSGASGGRRAGGGWRAEWEEQIAHVPVRLQAVMHRTRMPLRKVLGLQPGDLIKMPLTRLEEVHVMGTNGKAVARGKLGRQGMARAIRILEMAGRAAMPQATAPFDAAAPAFAGPPPGGQVVPPAPAPVPPPAAGPQQAAPDPAPTIDMPAPAEDG